MWWTILANHHKSAEFGKNRPDEPRFVNQGAWCFCFYPSEFLQSAALQGIALNPIKKFVRYYIQYVFIVIIVIIVFSVTIFIIVIVIFDMFILKLYYCYYFWYSDFVLLLLLLLLLLLFKILIYIRICLPVYQKPYSCRNCVKESSANHHVWMMIPLSILTVYISIMNPHIWCMFKPCENPSFPTSAVWGTPREFRSLFALPMRSLLRPRSALWS